MYLCTEYQCCRLTNKDTDMDREVPSQLTGQLDFGLRQRCGLHSRLVGKCVRACVPEVPIWTIIWSSVFSILCSSSLLSCNPNFTTSQPTTTAAT